MAQRKYYRKIYQINKRKKRVVFIFKFFVFSFLFFASCFLFLFIYFTKDLPIPEKFTERITTHPTRIYDRSGKVLLYEMYNEVKVTPVPLEIIPKHLINAIITAEDANFYHHIGIDFKAILRAILFDLKLKAPVQGGSTISQQLIRSSFLTREKTLKRKIREIILTLEIERRYSKDQILEFYLNQVSFGSNIYGVEQASQTFFNKSVQDITLEESAVLAGLIRAPSYLSPYGEEQEKLLSIKNYILDQMVKYNYITQEEADTAKQKKINFSKNLYPIKAPHFVLFVKDYLIKKYGENFLKQKGLKVYTSLDWELQQIAEKAIKEGMKKNTKFHAYNASLVAIDPNTGEILAMVGSKDFFGKPYPENCEPGKTCLFDPQVNISIYKIGRQPGSAFKPFVYATAFKKGYTPKTILWDVETNFGIYKTKQYIPKNYDKKFRGPVNLRQSLAQSINVPSVKLLYLVGIRDAIKTAQQMGITTLNQPSSFYGLSLVLGGGEVRLLDITSAYGVFASGGLKIPPVSVLKIKNLKGQIIEENKKTPKRVLKTKIANLINDILSDNQARSPMFGKKSALYFERYQVAAKTGTTQDFKDAWTIGYTPSIVVGVWVGNNNNAPMQKKPGVILAGPIWHSFMEKALSKYPKKSFEKPKPILTKKPILNGEIENSHPHCILYYIKKEDPFGSPPKNPNNDPQYILWEKGVQDWLSRNKQ